MVCLFMSYSSPISCRPASPVRSSAFRRSPEGGTPNDITDRVPSLFFHRRPALVRIETIHALKDLQRLGAEIFFIDHTVLADQERLHAGVPVLGRRSDQREPANHHALDHIIQLAQRRRRSLAFQHFEKVAVIRFAAVRIAADNSGRDLLADGAVPGAVSFLPGQTVLLPFGADDSLRVLVHAVYFFREGILMLRLDVTMTDFNRVQFVAADAAIQEFLPSGFRVEEPALADSYDRHGKRPILLADNQTGARLCLVDVDAHLRPGLGG